jgi:hypothetical protein
MDRDDDHLTRPVTNKTAVGELLPNPTLSDCAPRAGSVDPVGIGCFLFRAILHSPARKTLRGYTMPLNLNAFDKFLDDQRHPSGKKIADRLGQIRSCFLLTPTDRGLAMVDENGLPAGLQGCQ